MASSAAIHRLKTANNIIELSENKVVVHDLEKLVEKWCSILDKVK